MNFSKMDRNQIEEELGVYRKRLEDAMEIGGLAWWEMELPSGKVNFNSKKTEMIGYPEDRFNHYSDFTELLHPEDYERAMKAMQDHIEGKSERYEVEYRIQNKHGGYRWFRDVGGITEEKDGYKKVTGIVIDITDRKQIQEREELLNSLLRHDIRNKIQVIHGYLNLLSEMELPDKAIDYTNKSINSIQDSIDIIQKISKFKELQNEEIKEIDVEPILKEAIKKTQENAETQDIKIEFKKQTKKTKANAGPLLIQVFTNIIENSIQHSDGTKIKISSQKTQNKLQYIIEDNGKGIPKKDWNKVFNRTYTTDGERGTGLGLYLSKTLLSNYGGEIELDKSKMGGAKFTVTLQKANQKPRKK
ncbi:Signal transduction histidine kinase containing PAS domain [Methanonatronarchaeum thermophilum]|uniref:histidine kinase n=1 Tax=Methanonatronarchaeum thermophilum TaxID=1927129 RepID=A0A1Y3G9M4_9EURY|nr:PAS domain-containing sensor histidine kinase [Methanonatronarchaeum thermophilum]OUJ18141.1 Signal transduction histidine kinase containing PAS domain [Methanonatronarchaeum thermophilum]